MQSLLECDSLSWSARDFPHRGEHCPATCSFSVLHSQTRWICLYLNTHPGGIALQVWVHNTSMATWLFLSRYYTRFSVSAEHQTTSTFSKTASCLLLFDQGQWEWCLSGPVGALLSRNEFTVEHLCSCDAAVVLACSKRRLKFRFAGRCNK